MALRYVERYATTRAKLGHYLRRKLADRGWDGEDTPPVDALVQKMAERGYVNDRDFAAMKARSLTARGYGARRIDLALRAAGVSEDDVSSELGERQEDDDLAAALAYARRRRIGPFARQAPDADARRKALAALLRAGHSFEIARRILAEDYCPNSGQ